MTPSWRVNSRQITVWSRWWFKKTKQKHPHWTDLKKILCSTIDICCLCIYIAAEWWCYCIIICSGGLLQPLKLMLAIVCLNGRLSLFLDSLRLFLCSIEMIDLHLSVMYGKLLLSVQRPCLSWNSCWFWWKSQVVFVLFFNFFLSPVHQVCWLNKCMYCFSTYEQQGWGLQASPGVKMI